MIRVSAGDHTVRTAILEARYVWGDEALYDQVAARFWKDVVAGKVGDFVKEKLDERDARHRRMGDSRYVVEPNVKEGKGGLRDLHALVLDRQICLSAALGRRAGRGRPVLRRRARASSASAERFLWAVRCHLHLVAGRAEERLTFDYQREIAARMNYADRPGKSPVERFMRHYFLHAKTVGDLTGVFLAHLDEKFARRGSRIGLPAFRRRPGRLEGFMLDRGRLAVPNDDFLAEDPVRLVQMFALADRHGLEIHPLAMRAAARHAKLIDARVRADPRANALFLDVLTSPRDPGDGAALDERGGRVRPLRSRFRPRRRADAVRHVPSLYGRRAFDPGDRPAARGSSAACSRRIIRSPPPCSRRSRRAARSTSRSCSTTSPRAAAATIASWAPRSRSRSARGSASTDAETETVAWLVRWHLLMSATAFKRDLADPKTIQDFVERVKSLERLRLLFLLTVVDIRAVGPGHLEQLEEPAAARIVRRRRGDASPRPQAEGPQGADRRHPGRARPRRLGWEESRFARFTWRLPDSYWLAEPLDVIERNARFLDAADRACGKARAGSRPWSRTSAAPPWSRSTPRTSRASSTGSPGRSAWPAATSSTPASTPPTTAWRSTISWSRTAIAAPFADPHQLERLEAEVARALEGHEPSADRLAARALAAAPGRGLPNPAGRLRR